MSVHLNDDQVSSIRKSYFNILALFLEQGKLETRFLKCLLKWGFQLHLSPDDLYNTALDIKPTKYKKVEEKIEKLEAIYHLVHMIYLDKVVEEAELEVAMIYAKELGFESTAVSEFFKSIATAAYDEDEPRDVRQEVIDFIKSQEEFI